MRVAVVGAGWAGLAAAVRATQAGHRVTLFEAAPIAGGRARSDAVERTGGEPLDNGQHVLLGGYDRTLDLMRTVGVDPAAAFLRQPLGVAFADGRGFALNGRGARLADAARALLTARGFGAADKASAVATALAWRLRGFRCDDALTVDGLLRTTATARLRRLLFEPLCIAALNTPPDEASAAVFLAVMRDGVFGARAASDLLVPRMPLARLLPLPAIAWLRQHGGSVKLRERVHALERVADGWRVHAGAEGADRADADPAPFDRVVLATPASEAARLARSIAPGWSALAAALAHEAIATLVVEWPSPLPPGGTMVALESDATHRPAQFVFFSEAAPGVDARAAFVVSAASPWLERGLDGLATAILAQAREAFHLPPGVALPRVGLRADRRATFRCVAGLRRPPADVADGVLAAADFVAGPYPGTLEAAVRAGEAAVRRLPPARHLAPPGFTMRE